MRISELSSRTGVPVATLKYYLREGLVHAGRSLSKTQSDYDDEHVRRVELIRSLVEVGGLSLSAVRAVLEAMDSRPPRQDLLAHAQSSLLTEQPAAAEDDLARAKDLVERLGWQSDVDGPITQELARALGAAERAGVGFSDEHLLAYGRAMHDVAEADVAEVPQESQDAVAVVVVGTVLGDQMLAALRRLAHQDVTTRSVSGAP